jgi:transcriptional regulator with XRE-family HTH domain
MAQEAVAFAAGDLSTGSVARAELGQTAPSWHTVVSIARGLGVSLGELGALIDAEYAKRAP